jgi:uncharacterized protein (TIGR03382 family)
LLEPSVAGSHAVVYTEAARAWLQGGDPWSVGPPAIVFAGPPTMLLPFAPFIFLPELVTRLVWIGGMGLLAIWSIRRLRLPAYWILFPPLFGSVVLGHPEVLGLALLIAGGALSGLAAVIKPYAGLPLLAQWRWRAIGFGLAVVLVSAVVLPWGRFIDELPRIAATLARQAQGDSTFGNPALMALAVAALAVLGARRALWLATPLLWPSAQPIYKVISLPELSPVLAIFWAMPIPGSTLAGLLVEAGVRIAARRLAVPAWVLAGVEPMATPIPGATGPIPAPALWRRARTTESIG